MHYLIIYAFMFIGNKYNANSFFLGFKFLVFQIILYVFFKDPYFLSILFDFFNKFFKTEWIAREWQFRVYLDLFIPYFGMLCAWAFIKIQEWKLPEKWEGWEKTRKLSIILSVIGMIWYFAFEITRESKLVYNQYHTWISFIPVASFIVLRNSTVYLRSTSSKFFIFFGQCSLETFILQFNIWLGADTKGILFYIPVGLGGGNRWINFVISSLIFVFVSHWLSNATGVLTDWICTVPKSIGSRTGDGEKGSNVASPTEEGGGFLKVLKTDLRARIGLILFCFVILNYLYPGEPMDAHILPLH
jgi:N-acetylneuraminate 9-O-acetyltransferase